jgi:hypothetical protein
VSGRVFFEEVIR